MQSVPFVNADQGNSKVVSGARSVSLEIYVIKSGRWQIHSNYPIQESERWIEDANELDVSRQFAAVCVGRAT